jgi:probable phosphoglycerate mutase
MIGDVWLARREALRVDSVEVILVRHGRPHRMEGVPKPDPGLTEAGLAQADAVSEALTALPIRLIASSHLTRARQTAEPTARRLGMSVEAYADLAELDFGSDVYISIEEMDESDPRLVEWRRAMADPSTQVVVASFRQRVIAAVDRLARRIDSGAVVVFCHGGVIGVCFDHTVDAAPGRRDDPAYGSITRISVSSDGQ